MNMFEIVQQSSLKEIESSQLEVIKNDSQNIFARIEKLNIPNESGYQNSVNFLQKIKQLKIKIDSIFDPVIKMKHQAHKQSVKVKRLYTDPLINAETLLSKSLKSIRLSNSESK